MLLRNWILVADGSQARLLQQAADHSLHLLDSWDDPRGRQQFRWAPGDTFEHSDPQRHAQQEFARRLAETLNQRESEYFNLILVAAPRTLGDLRRCLEERVRQKVHLQIDRDWTHVSLHELPERLQKMAYVTSLPGSGKALKK